MVSSLIYKHNLTTYPSCLLSSLFWHIQSSSSKSSSSKSSGSGSRDGRGVCGESDGYCKDYDSSFLNFKKEGGNDKGGDSKSRDNKSSDKSSKSSRSSKSSTSSGSRDGSRRTDRCFRACDTDRCTSDDRRRLECPASTAASSDFVQKGQASPIQKLVWGGDEPDPVRMMFVISCIV